MLELSSYQIFFMILHGCLIAFAIAFLVSGNTRSKKNSKVVSYDEFKRHRTQRKRKSPSSQTHPVRDVYEVAAGDGLSRSLSQYSTPGPQLMVGCSEDTFTDFYTDTAFDFSFDD